MATCAMLGARAAGAEELSSCIAKTVRFDGVAPLTYATVQGEQGSRAYLHPQYPAQCNSTEPDSCKGASYVLAGDALAVGKSCGAWAYVQYIGAQRVTVGWVNTSRLKERVPPQEPTGGGTFRFRLTRGHGAPVCEAYLQRLNQSFRHAQNSPVCGRPESDVVPGFALLTRVPLDATEVTSLLNPVYNFTQGTRFEDNVYIFPANGGPPVVKPRWTVEQTQEMFGRSLFVWRYRPRLDIDNDGTTGDVIVWQGEGAGPNGVACGDYGVGPTPQVAFRQPQLAFVLTNGKLDPARTLAAFGHPVQAYTATDTRRHSSQFKPHFRPVGTSIGIFEYRGQYYFDSFFDIWGDFADQRRDRPSLANTLGVFQRRDGATRQICEYQVDGQDYPTSKTWEVLP